MSELLERMGWSQRFFANHIGVSEQTVTRWNREGAPEYVLVYLRQCVRLLGL